MTGIDRLRTLAGAWDEWGLGGALADVADQIEREQNEDAEAIAWVREHGGLAEVEKEWNVRSNLKRSLETAQAKVERQQRHIEFVQGKCRERQGCIVDLNNTIAEMRPRLMPEGMAWLVEAWPRFEDDSPVRLIDDFERYGEESGVSAVTMYADGSFALNCRAYSKGERVNRPAPKVLDADSAEILVGDTVYHVKDGSEMTVCGIDGEWLVVSVGGRVRHDIVTHRAPVLAADGKPLLEGETVWDVDGRGPLAVWSLPEKSDMHVSLKKDGTFYYRYPEKLTHERPVADTWKRLEEDADRTASLFDAFDADASADILDLVRRARALAERERCE